jgi:Transposase DDE domain
MTESDLHRLRIVRRAKTLFARLADAGCDRDAAGNRTLLYSHYASLVLLSLFNPVMHSLRGLQTASEFKKVQRKLGTGRVSLGSLSESGRVFDPALLRPLIDELLAALPASHPGPGPRRHLPDPLPRELAERLVVADGSALAALPQIVRASAAGDWKLHLQFRPLDGRPHALHLAREYAVHELDVLRGTLTPGCVYLADRGYEQYALYNAVVAAKSDYVIRGQDRPATIVAERRLSDAAIAARVVSDAVITLNRRKTSAATIDHPVRRIVIAQRDRGRPRSDRATSGAVILYTSLLDPPAEVIAAIYELRWSIELFFRFLKQVLGLKRLFSDKPEAVAIQVYCAVIACLLLAQAVGGRVTTAAFRVLSFYLQGWADEEELLAYLSKLREREA